MAWTNRQAIPVPVGGRAWSFQFAQCPTPLRIDDETIRIYYGTRDSENRTRTTFIDVDAENPTRIRYRHDQPVLELGALGCFDDAGVMPSCAVRAGQQIRLYYSGWNTSTTVPYRVSIGVAESDDGGRSFTRPFDGPILDRSAREPHFCSTPFVMEHENVWRMWYLACLDWEIIDRRPEPRYLIRSAESSDGFEWSRTGATPLTARDPDECQARPWIVKTGNLWEMWFCRRSRNRYRTDKNKSYRIERAESVRGEEWSRPGTGGLDVSDDGWDSEMTAYPAVYEHRGVRHLLYNGNGFGQGGFGHAVWSEE
ncbi:MAG: hypothetical protein AB7O26_05555 [Planctomycetaceae bacterium]